MSVSPPKPWERAGAGAVNSALNETSSSPAPSTAQSVSSSSSSSSSSPPPVPPRPTGNSALTSGYRPGAYATGSTGYGSPYGTGYGGSVGYGGGAYNRFGTGYGGTYGSTYGGAYGSAYGGSYGGPYGSRYSSYGTGYGGSMYGPNRSYLGGATGPYDPMGVNGPPGGDPSLVQRMEAGTASTFQMLESIVGVFAGLSQMLESTYMATHSSFMAMIGVAEQFGHLRGYLGQIFSVFALIRLVKRFWAWVRGRSSPSSSAASLTLANFESFVPGQVGPSSGPTGPAKPSRRPLLLFLAVIVGLPWLVSRIIKASAASSSSSSSSPSSSDPTIEGALPEAGKKIRAADLEFVRALHPFEGEGKLELTLAPGDLVAVLAKGDGWWRGRTRDGRVGLFPANYVELLEKRKTLPDSSSSPGDGSILTGNTSENAVSAIRGGGNLDPEEFSRRMS